MKCDFSYHSYSGVEQLMEQTRYVRKSLDEAGFKGLETCLNEWLPAPKHEKLGTAQQAALASSSRRRVVASRRRRRTAVKSPWPATAKGRFANSQLVNKKGNRKQ